MSPAGERTVQDVILDEIRQIRQAIHDLRDSMHTEIGALATRIHKVELTQSGQDGALRAMRWMGAVIIAALGALEAWFHRGHP
jgi:HAMP domain-containing protein